MVSLVALGLVAFAVSASLPAQAIAKETARWPALQFDITALRSSMQVHGQSRFSVYAAPIVSDDGSKVLYDELASFTEDTATFNYTVVDGVSYLSTSPSSAECLETDASRIPSINAIVAAINDVVAVSGVGNNVTNCSSGDVFKASVGGLDFAVCASGSSGFSMHGSDLDIAVTYLEDDIDIQAPTVDGEQCVVGVSASRVTSLGKALLTSQPIPSDERSLKAAFDFDFTSQDEAACTCKSKRRPCIFIHGLGVKNEVRRNQNTYVGYWGDHLKKHAPCCSSMKFAHLNTINDTWVDASLQRKVCNRALAVSKTSKRSVIKDTIIITHSMGNLMLAGALSTGACRLDRSSTWVGIAGPMKGSMASDFVLDSCAEEANVVWQEIAEVTGRCPPNKALTFLAYSGGNHTSKRLEAAYAAAQKAYRKNVYALMCGKSFSGITTKYQAQFWALGAMIPHKSKENDGMVEFKSCAAGFPASKFGDSYSDRFYAAKLNHYDLAFRSGDALIDDAKMPVKWFECLL